VLGEAAPESWREIDLAAHPVHGDVMGKLAREGVGSNVLGDPRVALQWLVNELSRNGIVLEAGQTVSTGTCVIPMAIAPGDHVSGDFGPLGTIEVRIG
jgi:2-keto-4-pentenoate hydratase